MAEFSDAQYEKLIDLLAENRVALRELDQRLELTEQSWDKRFVEIRTGMRLQGSALEAIEQDLSRVQKDMRSVAQSILEHDQALDGITQLCKTNYDLLASQGRRSAGRPLAQSAIIEHEPASEIEQTQ